MRTFKGKRMDLRNQSRRTPGAVMILWVGGALVLGCASPRARETTPVRPLSSAELALGYQDAVALGSQHLAAKGIVGAELSGAEQVWPNVWCVRFGLLPKGSGRRVDLYFDGTRKTLIKEVSYLEPNADTP